MFDDITNTMKDKQAHPKKCDLGYFCRADNAAYPHNSRADKQRYGHERCADYKNLT